MAKIISIIVAAVALVSSVLYGKNQADKRKSAEEKAKKAEQELKDQSVKVQVAEAAHISHVDQIGETIAKSDEELVGTANELFASALTVGAKLKKARTSLGWSLIEASKKSGYTASRVSAIENNKSITEEDINKLGKAYGLEKSCISELKKQLNDSSSKEEDR